MSFPSDVSALFLARPLFWIGVCALFGACVASFINLFAWRWPQMAQREWIEEIRSWFDEKGWKTPPEALQELQKPRLTLSTPGSHCTACRASIPFWSNVPVLGWLFLRGRSFCCKRPISPRYPLGEALGAASCGLAAIWFGPSWQTPLAMAALLCLQASALTDLESYLLPDGLSGFLLGLGLFACAFGYWPLSIQDSLLGALCGYAALEALRLGARAALNKEAMGQGDPKLLAAIGAWIGPAALAPSLLIASLAGLLAALVGQALSRRKASDPVPFGPFLALGGAALLFLKEPILALLGMPPSFFPLP